MEQYNIKDIPQRIIDPASGNTIRPTDNGLKEGDKPGLDHKRPLTETEIEEYIKEL